MIDSTFEIARRGVIRAFEVTHDGVLANYSHFVDKMSVTLKV
jgi:hypothetical protein